MSKKQLKALIMALTFLSVMLLCACAGAAGDTQSDGAWDAKNAVYITLSGNAISVNSNTSETGVSVDGTTATITKAGTYVLEGTLNDGQIIIEATKKDEVQLVLNGASLSCSTSAPIWNKKASKLIVTLADNTVNTVNDSATYVYAEGEDEPDAAIFSKDDLTVNGSGTLTVQGNYNNGIGTKDNLVINGGTIIVTAVNDGLRGRDSVTITGGSFTITSGNDGIKSNNDEDTSKGWIIIEGGVFGITAAYDGIQAETSLTVSGGQFTIVSGGGSENAAERSEYGWNQGGMLPGQQTATTTTSTDSSDSYKGLKAGTTLEISGGIIYIDAADDTVHANGDITITGGQLSLLSGDDGVHADGALTIAAGTIEVEKSYEGLEGATVSISGGVIRLTASDDAINAAGGTDSTVGMFGRDSFLAGGSSDYWIEISGGDIAFTAGGDGIDSNGALTISGGTIIALINSTMDNEALDCDGTFTITGGTIIYGGTGTGGTSTTAQSYVYINTGVPANSVISLQKDGVTLVSFTPEIDCQNLIFSLPDIVSGESYGIYSNGSLLTTTVAGTGGGSGMFGGGGGGGRNQGGNRKP